MRVAVTGGLGFIGSAYVRALLADELPMLPRPERVTVIDKMTYAARLRNLGTSAWDDPRLEVVKMDIVDLPGWFVGGYDVLLNFAAESHVDRSITDASAFVRTNVLGTQRLLDIAHKWDVKRFVQISTDEVYGSITFGAWDENEPLSPNSPYAASKAAADMLVQAYHRTHGLDTVITRCSNNYGPHQYPEKIIPLFITNLLRGVSVPLYGGGQNVREWVHVDDHVRGIALAQAAGQSGEVYNIGGGAEMTNEELTNELLKLCDGSWEHDVDYVEDRKGHDLRYALDGSKALKELGYAPLIKFPQGLADTVDWYRQNESWWEDIVR